MLIDWFTVVAQIVNFLILIVLLKRFLYMPLLRAMDERQKKIADGLRAAEQARQQARQQADALARQRKEFVDQRQALLETAHREVETWQQQALEDARTEVAAARRAWQDSVAAEEEAFLRKLKIRTSQQVFRVAAKVLAELADASLESQLLNTFLARLPDTVEVGSGADIRSVEVRTGFPLSVADQHRFGTELSAIYPQADLQFIEEPTLGFGLCLVAEDRKVEWNLTRYLDDMEAEIVSVMRHIVGGTS